ncbi:MAG: transcription antitermination factor NusB [Actinobacteria bacterium]|nr:transcription antitermination factor NusB [Actinomycetota bacterium]
MPKRSKARVLALQIIFQLPSQSDGFLEQVDDFVTDAHLDAGLSRYARDLALGAWANRSEADALIDKFARDWTASSLPAVDSAILRLAIYEMLHCSDVPAKVAIDEAIKLAKTYSTGRSSQFINGLLDTIMKSTLSDSENSVLNNQSSEQ